MVAERSRGDRGFQPCASDIRVLRTTVLGSESEDTTPPSQDRDSAKVGPLKRFLDVNL